MCDSWSSLQDSILRRMEFGSRIVLFWYMGWCKLGRIRASFGGSYTEEASMTSRGCEMAGCVAQVQTWLQLAARHPAISQDHSRTAERGEGFVNPLVLPALRSNGCATRVKSWMRGRECFENRQRSLCSGRRVGSAILLR